MFIMSILEHVRGSLYTEIQVEYVLGSPSSEVQVEEVRTRRGGAETGPCMVGLLSVNKQTNMTENITFPQNSKDNFDF